MSYLAKNSLAKLCQRYISNTEASWKQSYAQTGTLPQEQTCGQVEQWSHTFT